MINVKVRNKREIIFLPIARYLLLNVNVLKDLPIRGGDV